MEFSQRYLLISAQTLLTHFSAVDKKKPKAFSLHLQTNQNIHYKKDLRSCLPTAEKEVNGVFAEIFIYISAQTLLTHFSAVGKKKAAGCYIIRASIVRNLILSRTFGPVCLPQRKK
jgi:hypothetical protein